jgi:hypothetical protein
LIDRITHACIGAGAYTISVGTMNPAIVLPRLLDALAVLNPRAYRALVAPDGVFVSIPPEILHDPSNPWWDTATASRILQIMVGALNAAAPAGFCCVYSDGDRFELARYDEPRRPREPAQPPVDTRPSSRVRCRVAAPEP